jgi:hypothetical protein
MISNQRASRCSIPMEPVAGGRLGGLHALDHGVSAGRELELGSRPQYAAQGIDPYPESIPGDL